VGPPGNLGGSIKAKVALDGRVTNRFRNPSSHIEDREHGGKTRKAWGFTVTIDDRARREFRRAHG
jgi:hypothetical protein